MIRKAMTAAGLAGLACVAVGFGGTLHPVCDSLAVFRLPLALGAMVLLLLTPRAVFWPAMMIGAMTMISVLWPRLQPGAPGDIAVYQKNLSFELEDHAPVIADILARRPDVVTLQEVTEANTVVLDGLAADYPTQALCPWRTVGGAAIATRWPALGDPVCVEDSGFVALKVLGPSGPVWLVSLHLLWPWPHGQAEQVDRLIGLFEEFDGPVLLAGDFNMVPWASAVRRLAAATGTVHSGPLAPTFYIAGRIPLPIDHVLAGGGAAEVLPMLGSDHNGVLALVSLPRR